MFDIHDTRKFVNVRSSNRVTSRLALTDGAPTLHAVVGGQIEFAARLVNVQTGKFVPERDKEVSHEAAEQVSSLIAVLLQNPNGWGGGHETRELLADF